ncbi:MAG: alpha/beta hydrolase-fold protein [Planctomycetota bacterium]
MMPFRALFTFAFLALLAVGSADLLGQTSRPGAKQKTPDTQGPPGPLRFAVSFNKDYRREAVDGSVYLIISKDLIGEPRSKVHNFDAPPHLFRVDVSGFARGDEIVFDESSPGFPTGLLDLSPGRYGVQAVIHQSRTDYDFTKAAGNGRSRLKRLLLDPQASGMVKLVVDKEIEQVADSTRTRVQYRNIESRLVGRHLGARFYAHVAVVLPENYPAAGEEKKAYPVQYWIPTLGDRARGALSYFQRLGLYFASPEMRTQSADFIRVIIDPHGPWGHHLWMDSAVNGPFRTALFEELIPAIEEEFSIDARPKDRFLVGYGLGGWAATNLIAHRPDFFNSAWVLAADPLDFQSFYGLNLKSRGTGSVFIDEQGAPRAFARHDGKVVIDFKHQLAFEGVLGRGGLLTSFESSLGLRSGNKSPLPLIDRRNGNIDDRVRRQFLESDLSQVIARGGSARAQSIARALHLRVGDKDDFYLVNPTLHFRRAVEKFGTELDLVILTDHDHPALSSKEVQIEVQKKISRAWRAAK